MAILSTPILRVTITASVLNVVVNVLLGGGGGGGGGR